MRQQMEAHRANPTWAIDDVALITSTTMPTWAETRSAGVKATSTRTPIR